MVSDYVTPGEDECYLCGEDDSDALETHHIVPRRHGGSNDDENLVDLCKEHHRNIESIYDHRFYRELGIHRWATRSEMESFAAEMWELPWPEVSELEELPTHTIISILNRFHWEAGNTPDEDAFVRDLLIDEYSDMREEEMDKAADFEQDEQEPPSIESVVTTLLRAIDALNSQEFEDSPPSIYTVIDRTDAILEFPRERIEEALSEGIRTDVFEVDNGGVKYSNPTTSPSEDPLRKYIAGRIFDTVERLSDDDRMGVDVDVLLQQVCDHSPIGEDHARGVIEDLRSKGELYKPRLGRVAKT